MDVVVDGIDGGRRRCRRLSAVWSRPGARRGTPASRRRRRRGAGATGRRSGPRSVSGGTQAVYSGGSEGTRTRVTCTRSVIRDQVGRDRSAEGSDDRVRRRSAGGGARAAEIHGADRIDAEFLAADIGGDALDDAGGGHLLSGREVGEGFAGDQCRTSVRVHVLHRVAGALDPDLHDGRVRGWDHELLLRRVAQAAGGHVDLVGGAVSVEDHRRRWRGRARPWRRRP